MKKRVIALFTAASAALTSTTAYAHNEDVFGGKYTDRTDAKFFVRIHSSAENSIFTFKDVYLHGEDWNGISSNVNLYVMRVGESESTDLNQINVFGGNLNSDDDKGSYVTLGRMFSYDMHWNECLVDEDWCYSRIGINTSLDTYVHYLYECEDSTVAARKVFMHELGHALKLAHPIQSTTHNGVNSYDGYPHAIMNRGELDQEVCASNTITDHDKSCLIGKWGK